MSSPLQQSVDACSAHKASLESVYWERDVVDGQDLLDRLKHAEHIMRQPQTTPLRLLIVDSIAHLFRDVGDKPQIAAFAQRTGILFRISALLRRFADTYNLAVVVTNQVNCTKHVVMRTDSYIVYSLNPLHRISWY